MNNIIVVPPEFGILFLIPIIGTYFVFDKTDDLMYSALFYITTQIGLACLAHHIYG